MNDRYTPTFNIHEAVRKTLPYMMEMREYFHAHPELSEKEFDTCKTIFQELSLMGIEDVKIIAGTGVTGLIHGALPGPVILLRADIDALPLTEKFDCPYSSLVDGVMHACGHDGHAANLLGVAKILNKHKDCLRGTIRLAFQPAEEGNGGAARMIDAGILNNPRVDYALGLHVAGSLPKGYVGIGRGEISASCDDFTITLHAAAAMVPSRPCASARSRWASTSSNPSRTSSTTATLTATVSSSRSASSRPAIIRMSSRKRLN